MNANTRGSWRMIRRVSIRIICVHSRSSAAQLHFGCRHSPDVQLRDVLPRLRLAYTLVGINALPVQGKVAVVRTRKLR